MHSARTTREAVGVALRSVEDWIEKGICVTCAIKATAAQYLIPYEQLEDLYVQSKMSVFEKGQ